MNKYQNEQYGERTAPEFGEAHCFFVQMDNGYLRIKDCSEQKKDKPKKQEWVFEIVAMASDSVGEEWSNAK